VSERPVRDDRGTTLAELAIAMLVFGLFATFLATTVVQTTRFARTSAVRETAAQQASAVMAQVTKDLRTAWRVNTTTSAGPPALVEQLAFLSASPTDVTFYSSVEPPVRERLHSTGGAVHRVVMLSDAGSAYPDLQYTSTDPTRTTTRRLTTTGTTASLQLRYLLAGGGTVTSVPDASRADVTGVEVTVSVDGDMGGPLKPVVLQSTVRPYNP
jgi:type II secretory pathway pseudopilin PulG